MEHFEHVYIFDQEKGGSHPVWKHVSLDNFSWHVPLYTKSATITYYGILKLQFSCK